MKKKLNNTIADFEKELKAQLPILFLGGRKDIDFNNFDAPNGRTRIEKLETKSFKLFGYFKTISKSIDQFKK